MKRRILTAFISVAAAIALLAPTSALAAATYVASSGTVTNVSNAFDKNKSSYATMPAGTYIEVNGVLATDVIGFDVENTGATDTTMNVYLTKSGGQMGPIAYTVPAGTRKRIDVAGANTFPNMSIFTTSDAVRVYEIAVVDVWEGLLDGKSLASSPNVTDNNPTTYNDITPGAEGNPAWRYDLGSAGSLTGYRLKYDQQAGGQIRVDWFNASGTSISFEYVNPGEVTKTFTTPVSGVRYIGLTAQTGSTVGRIYEFEAYGTGFTPTASFSGGLLDGKPMNIGPSVTTSSSTTGLITDNNTATSMSGVGNYFWYEFAESVDITQVIGSTPSNTTVLKFYNSSGVQIGDQMTVANGSWQNVNYSQVKKLSLQANSGGAWEVAEFNVKGAAPPDTTPPTAPVDLTATEEEGAIQLYWNPVSDAASYKVYRDGTQVASGINGPMWTDTTAEEGVTYSYEVTAIDAAGNESPKSAAATAMIEGPPPPTGPGRPREIDTKVSDGTIVLKWSAPTTGTVAKYFVYRDSVKIAEVTTPTYTDSGLTNGTKYSYNITAVDADGLESEPAMVMLAPSKNAVDLGDTVLPFSVGAMLREAVDFLALYGLWVALVLGVVFSPTLYGLAVRLVRYVAEYMETLRSDRSIERKYGFNPAQERREMYDYLSKTGRIKERDAWAEKHGNPYEEKPKRGWW